MTKQELIDKMAEGAEVSKKEAEDALNAFVDAITKALQADDKVAVTGFGTFSVSQRKARTGVNPQNPTEKIQIPAVKVPKFKAGKTLKDAIK
ncbi:HU family DNA-binding protein [Patescibacteria group bacterium]